MSSVQTNETHQPYGNPPQSQSSVLPPFLSYRSAAEQRLTENSQRLAGRTSAYDYGYHNSAVEAPASSYPSQSTDWPTTHSDDVQPHRYPYSPQRHGGSYGGQGWQDVVQPFTSSQYQAGPYAFPQGYIPISHERTSGSAAERRVEPDSPEPITRGPTDFRSMRDYSHPTPLSTVPYLYQENDSSGGHDTVSHTRNDEVDAHHYSHYNSRPNYSRVSAAIHRLQVLGSSQSAPPLLSDSFQHTLAPQQFQQEESVGVAPIAPMSSTDTPDVRTIRSPTSERLPPSMEPLSPVWEFGPHDPGDTAVQDKDRRRQSDDDGEYVESPERRRTDEQEPWHEEKKKIVMACHFCRRRKLRCSGEQPCGNCAKRSMACEYDDTVKRRGKGKKTLRKASFRKNTSVSSELTGTADVGATDPCDRSREPGPEVRAQGSARLDGTGSPAG